MFSLAVSRNALVTACEPIGRLILGASHGAGYGVLLLGQSLWWLRAFWKRRAETLKQMHFSGVASLGVCLVVALFTGMILSVQAGRELARFQQQEIVGSLVAVTMAREMGPFMTAIILAACVGSAIAAEIGTMRVSEEIDALEVMSINPVMFLVMPRVVALTLVCPALTVLTNIVAVVGGAIVCQSLLGVGYYVYFDNALEILELKDLYSGLVKATVFGTAVATIGCTQGMLASGGARGVGDGTRNAVVHSLLMILILGYFLTRVFYDVA